MDVFERPCALARHNERVPIGDILLVIKTNPTYSILTVLIANIIPHPFTLVLIPAKSLSPIHFRTIL